MKELIDQNITKQKDSNSRFRLINTLLFCLSLGMVPFTVIILYITKMNLDSPFLPNYTIYYMNAGLINFTLIQLMGVIPGFYLRIKGNNLFSTYCLLGFFFAGLILRNIIPLYQLFV